MPCLIRKSFTVDGETVDVIKDFQVDVLKTTNSFLWIPSLRAVIAGDGVFSGRSRVPWDSSGESRRFWHDSLQLIAVLQPRVVVAGYKKNAGVPDSQQAITSMEKCLDDFESARKAASNADQDRCVRKFLALRRDRLRLDRSTLSCPQ
jgi:hypothetical protein